MTAPDDRTELVLRDVAETFENAGYGSTSRWLLRAPRSSADYSDAADVCAAHADRHMRQTQRDHAVMRGAERALRHLAKGDVGAAVRALADREAQTINEWLTAARELREAQAMEGVPT